MADTAGHEYTEFFAPFAAWLEPTNAFALQKLDFVLRQRYGFAYPLATIPSTVDEERRCNPFFRCATEPQTMATLVGVSKTSTPADVLRAVNSMSSMTGHVWDLPCKLQRGARCGRQGGACTWYTVASVPSACQTAL